MCYPGQARPPLPPILGAASDASDLVLTSADGTKFAAYAARAEKPTGVGMVILPDVRGLHEFYKELARRFAEAGMDAIAIDYFGRTAGLGPRDDSFDYKAHMPLNPSTVNADVAAAVAYLRSKEGGSIKRVYTVGFCFGGAQSWRQSAAGQDLAGAIGFYGIPSRVRDVIPRMKSPLLLLIAGDDRATTQEDFQQFDRELTQAKVPHRVVVYPGAPHSFFDRTYRQHREACQDAWRQILDFVGVG
jgi:carboxymethylenebutenolidase